MRRRIVFDECDSADEVCGWLNKIRADQDQIEAKTIQNAQEIEALKPKKKGKSKMKSEGSASMRVIAIMMLIVAIAGLCYAAYVPADITYEIAANPESLSIYLRDSFGNITSNSYLFTPTNVTPPAAEGKVYYKKSASTLYLYTGSAWEAMDVAGGLSLDAAYDVGATITVDNGTVILTASEGANNIVLELIQQDTDSTDAALHITTAGASSSYIAIDVDGNSSGRDFEGTGAVAYIEGDGSIIGLDLDVTGSVGIILQNDETITNTVNSEIMLKDSGASNELIFDLDAGDTKIELKSGDVVEFGFGTVDQLTGVESITGDATDFTISHTGNVTGYDLLITQLGSGDNALTLTSAGTATDAIGLVSSAGITMTSTVVASSWTQTATGIDDDLTISVAGNYDASLILSSAGTGSDALSIFTSHANGDIKINSTDTIDIDAANGIAIDVAGTSGEDITLTNTGGSIILSATEGATDAVNIDATGTNGGIDLDTSDGPITLNAVGATNGDITLDAGDKIDMDSAGTFALNVAGETLLIQVDSDGAGDDLTLNVDGDDDSHILISSDGTSIDTIQLLESGTGTGGGILIRADTGTASADGVSSIQLLSDVGGIGIKAGVDDTDAIDIDASVGSVDIDAAKNVTINAGTDITIQVDSTTAGDDLLIRVDGDDDSHITLDSDGTSIDTIYIHQSGSNTGAGIKIHADTGTAYADATASITLLSDVGGIGIKATGLAQNDAIVINAVAGGVNIDAATSYDVAINGGQVKIEAEDNVTSAISLITNTGTTETIVITNTLGDSDAAINIDATAGGYALDAAKSIVLTSSEAQADAIQITTSDGSGGIVLNAGNSIISMSDDDISNVGDLAVDDIVADANDNVVISAVKCLVVTISSDDSPDTDFNFDNSQANQTEQGIRVGVIPAYSEIIAVFIRCTETVTASTTMGIEVGTATGGDQIVATSNCDTANDTMGTATGESPEIAASSTAISVWISATPGTNWNTPHNEGSWTICILYADYAAAMSESG